LLALDIIHAKKKNKNKYKKININTYVYLKTNKKEIAKNVNSRHKRKNTTNFTET